MSLLEQTKSLLRTYRIVPKKYLGQNFSIEQSVFNRLIDLASLNENDTVLEIGAGLGFLTRSIAEKCRKVLAVEADPVLVGVLHERLKGVPNVQILHGNVLKVRVPHFDKVVSIPPYNISSRLVEWLFPRKFDRAVLVFQREYANHLVASVGSDDYSWLTAVAYYYLEVELSADVPREVFYPQPEVESVIVRLKPKTHPFALRRPAMYVPFVRSLFRDRNRKVRNAILPFLKGVLAMPKEKANAAAVSIVFGDRRVRELAPGDFGALANAITA